MSGPLSAGQFRAESGTKLLIPHRKLVTAIRSVVGVPDTHWASLYDPMLEAFAALVQRLPASEAHHHAGPGGLLRHSLEVVLEALKLRRSLLLPHGAPAEELSRLQDLLSYACATGALLHDIGKPAVDQVISTVTDGKVSGSWSPLVGPMPAGTVYEVTFNRKRSYRRHERIVPLLARSVVPEAGLRWLASESEVLEAWLATLQGDMDEAGPLGEIVSKADGFSVARNLAGGVGVQMPSARTKPLAERLLKGLRHLLDSDSLPLNRPGAAGFLDGDTLWLVSKRALDALREHLIQSGQPGVPSRNDRLMDELQQHGLLVANGDRAVWNAEIRIGDWIQKLSCLRLEMSRIWPVEGQRPEPVQGRVTPLIDSGENESVSTAGGSLADTTPATLPVVHASISDQASREVETTVSKSMPHGSQTVAPSPTTSNSASTLSGLPLPFDIAGVTTHKNSEAESVTEKPNTEIDDCHYSSINNGTNPGSTAMTQATNHSPTDDADLGKRFVGWLTQNIRDERVQINTAKARVHVLPEGLALVSPGIFRDFSPQHWDLAQKRFQKLNLHVKAPGDTNIWTCRVVKSRKQSLIKVYLIPNPVETLDIDLLPPPNDALRLLNVTSNSHSE
ncbi:MAG: MobH family relaxase [Candidatus Sedimenticola endophacoides]